MCTPHTPQQIDTSSDSNTAENILHANPTHSTVPSVDAVGPIDSNASGATVVFSDSSDDTEATSESNSQSEHVHETEHQEAVEHDHPHDEAGENEIQHLAVSGDLEKEKSGNAHNPPPPLKKFVTCTVT